MRNRLALKISLQGKSRTTLTTVEKTLVSGGTRRGTRVNPGDCIGVTPEWEGSAARSKPCSHGSIILLIRRHSRKADESIGAGCDPPVAPGFRKMLRPIPCYCMFCFPTVARTQSWSSNWTRSVPSMWRPLEFSAGGRTSRRAHLQQKVGPFGRTVS